MSVAILGVLLIFLGWTIVQVSVGASILEVVSIVGGFTIVMVAGLLALVLLCLAPGYVYRQLHYRRILKQRGWPAEAIWCIAIPTPHDRLGFAPVDLPLSLWRRLPNHREFQQSPAAGGTDPTESLAHALVAAWRDPEAGDGCSRAEVAMDLSTRQLAWLREMAEG